jgi:putative acetyltransferase
MTASKPAGTTRHDITIRHIEPDDYRAIQRMFPSGSRTVWGSVALPLPSADYFRKRIIDLPEQDRWLVACIADDLVGSLGLHRQAAARRGHVASLGMVVRDDSQGQGVGAALMHAALDLADNWLNIVRIELQTWTDNAAGLALYRRFGFEIEGTARAYAFRDGRYIDAYHMARLRLSPAYASEQAAPPDQPDRPDQPDGDV